MNGYSNIHHVTASQILAQVQLSKGINPIAKVKASGVPRRPAVLIRSSPWKAGTPETPWHDVFDLDNGHVRYFGDHRVDHAVPVGATQGNSVLLATLAEHHASTAEERALATPLLVFAAVPRNNSAKGYVQFCGVAVIERAEQIEQEAGGLSYPNYQYDLAVLDLSAEGDNVDWAWIEARGDHRLSAAEALAYAPRSWRQWVQHGQAALPTVRRQSARPAADRGQRARLTRGEKAAQQLFPSPRPAPHSTGSPENGAASGELTARTLMERLRKLKTHQHYGPRSRHAPLGLLWSISRIASGGPRLAPWRVFRDEVGELMTEFDPPHSPPEYPFWHLRASHLWDVQGISREEGTPRGATLDRANPEGGMTEEAARLLKDPFIRSQAIAVIRRTYFTDVDQPALMTRLGLGGYETASGVVEGQQPGFGPAARRDVNASRIVRNVAVANEVKRMHTDHCQVCGQQLPTLFGTYSEAAHIRGLGHPHHGPDELSNLLVLCPNHHVQFDKLAIYVDPQDTVRFTVNNEPTGMLRRLAEHPIDQEHLRYQRALCGRDRDAEDQSTERS
ncbi:HNH endonuclease [Streptomyces pratensis]|uniref:HNH endonuclease n=1 Tax=Streptomyces pratensis TaxID=1169025 RepID=UPI00301773F4